MTELPPNVYRLRQSEFHAIPGEPWVYWLSEKIRGIFLNNPVVANVAEPRAGMHGGDRFRFARYWWEVGASNIARFCKSKEEVFATGRMWAPYMKGGSFRKWYGNQEWVVSFNQKFYKILSESGNKLPSRQYYFREGITYSAVTSTGFSTRLSPGGFIFDAGGSSLFPNNLFLMLANLNSQLSSTALKLINPTINIQAGDIARLPVTKSSSKYIEEVIPKLIRLCIYDSVTSENTYDFKFPVLDNHLVKSHHQSVAFLESKVNSEILNLFGLDLEAVNELQGENLLVESEGDSLATDDNSDEIDNTGNKEEALISYAIGIVLGRFFPGVQNQLGSAIHSRNQFVAGSVSSPSSAEFDELVGPVESFASIDAEGGRHVFSGQTEKALCALALPDGIAVLDEGHPCDLAARVHKALELILGDQGAQEVIQAGAGGDLRKYLEKDFFTQHHLRLYRKRPVYWYIQSSKRSYGFVLFHEKITKDTLFAIQRDPYLDTKRRGVELEMQDVRGKAAAMQGASRKSLERRLAELQALSEELAQFAKDLEEITLGGYAPEPNWIDDGVILRLAPLWKVIPLWKSEPKKYWERLQAGEFDWSHIAMKYWPERVKKACRKNKSYAIAHGHEEWYEGR